MQGPCPSSSLTAVVLGQPTCELAAASPGRGSMSRLLVPRGRALGWRWERPPVLAALRAAVAAVCKYGSNRRHSLGFAYCFCSSTAIDFHRVDMTQMRKIVGRLRTEGFESMGAAGPGKMRPPKCPGMDFGVQLQADSFEAVGLCGQLPSAAGLSGCWWWKLPSEGSLQAHNCAAGGGKAEQSALHHHSQPPCPVWLSAVSSLAWESRDAA